VADEIQRVQYFYTEVSDKPGEGLKVLNALRDEGVNLSAFDRFHFRDPPDNNEGDQRIRAERSDETLWVNVYMKARYFFKLVFFSEIFSR
jgi:hypothetical protein